MALNKPAFVGLRLLALALVAESVRPLYVRVRVEGKDNAAHLHRRGWMRASHIVNGDALICVQTGVGPVTDDVGKVRLVHNAIHNLSDERVLVGDVDLIVCVILDSLH